MATTTIDDEILAICDDLPIQRHSTRNLQFHQPVKTVALKATSGIRVKNYLQTIFTAINQANEVKFMLDKR